MFVKKFNLTVVEVFELSADFNSMAYGQATLPLSYVCSQLN